MLHTKFQPKYTKPFRRKNDFIGFVTLSIGIHLGFSTMLNFYHSESLKSGHAACEIGEPLV